MKERDFRKEGDGGEEGEEDNEEVVKNMGEVSRAQVSFDATLLKIIEWEGEIERVIISFNVGSIGGSEVS